MSEKCRNKQWLILTRSWMYVQGFFEWEVHSGLSWKISKWSLKKENKEENKQSLRRKLSCSKIQQFIVEAFNILWYKSGQPGKKTKPLKTLFFFKKSANFSSFNCEQYLHRVTKGGYFFSVSKSLLKLVKSSAFNTLKFSFRGNFTGLWYSVATYQVF